MNRDPFAHSSAFLPFRYDFAPIVEGEEYLMPTVGPFPLLSIDTVDSTGPQAAQHALAWVRDYLGTRDVEPRINRPFVCPFIPASLQRETLWIIVADGIHEASGTEQVIRDAAACFHALEPRTGSMVRFKTILVVFPDVLPDDAPACIDVVQKTVKSDVVPSRLLMVGQFHELNQDPSAAHADVRPFQSPVPMLALRVIVNEDYPKFLEVKGDNEEDIMADFSNHRAWYAANLRWAPQRAIAEHGNEWQIQIEEFTRLLTDLGWHGPWPPDLD
jgi:hypothetical protein